MVDFFPSPFANRSLRRAALALGLLAGPGVALAQTSLPSVIYGLGTATQDYGGLSAGQQLLLPLYPANLSGTSPLYGTGQLIIGVTAGQQLVGIDARPSTGQLYALGYNASTGAAQLYLLSLPSGSTTAVTATPVNATPITLNLQDPNSSRTGTSANTRALITNVGFDFNPRADRIRVVAPNGVNYRLNPNTGALVATDTNLSYAAGSTVGHAPYVGTVAYSNSAPAVAGTMLYDIDVTNTNALLSIQSPPNDGVLNPVGPVTFQTNSNGTFYPLASPTIGLDLDIYYDRGSSSNLAYLVEARYSDTNNQDINNGSSTNRFSSNLWAFDLQTGRAVGRNIFGQLPVFVSNIAAMSATQLVWTGAVSADWQTAGNWYPNQVPTAGDDVFIAGTGTLVGPGLVVASQPTVTATTSVARTLTLDNGATLTNANGSLLSLYGNFINNGGAVAGSGTGTLALAGAATQDVGGSVATSFWNLQIGSGGATTSAAEAIRRSVAVQGNLAIGSGQAFTLLSSAAGTAYVANNGGAVTGAATVQRYLDGSLNAQGIGYRHYSAPVTNTTPADLATSTYNPVFNTAYNSSAAPYTVSPFPTVYGYSQAQYESSPATTINTDFERGYFSPTASTPWVSGTAYTVNIPNSETVDFMGTLANGPYTVGSLTRSAKANAGWQLLGNPYPGAIDWNVVQAASAGINNALFVYKSTGQFEGNYASYVNGMGSNGGTNVLPLAQGFFVRTTAGQTGTVNFTNAARLNQPETVPFQRTAADLRPQLLLALGNGTKATQAAVYFESGATAAFDPAFDAEALPSANGLLLASEISDDLLTINGLPALAGTVTVPLRVAVAAAGTYTLGAASLANLPAGYHAYLRDASLNTYTDLAATPSVSVSLAAGTATGRFAVVFGTASPLATAPAALAALVAVYPNPAHGSAVLLLPAALRGQVACQVDVLNTLGQAVLRRTLPAGAADQLELPLSSLAAGIYTVRATTASGTVARQLRVE